MASQEPSQTDDPEIAHLKEVSAKGANNIIGNILKDPEVQSTIKNALLKETVKNAIIMSIFFIGLLNLYNSAKTLIGFNWIGDLSTGVALTCIGSVYMLKNFLKPSNHSAKD